MFRRVQPGFTSRLYLFAFLFFLAGGLMFADQAGLLATAKQVVNTVLAPVEGGTRQLGLNLANFSVFTTNLDQLRAENQRLRDELEATRIDKSQLISQSLQLEQLEKELAFKRNPANRRFDTVSADVVNYDPTGQLRLLSINKGSNAKIVRGMPVVDSSGYLVGRVERVDPDKATVLLITDSQMGVNVTTQRYENNKRVPVVEPGDGTAIGQWQSGGRVTMVRIKESADVKPGDWVFTNGLGGIYPPNILVGFVDKVVAQEGQPDKQAILRPFADLDRLQRVQIILKSNDE